MSISNYAENKILDHVTGRASFTAPSTVYIKLHTADAGELILEVHQNPDNALSDGDQSLKPERFAELMADLRRIAAAVDRSIATLPAEGAEAVNGRVKETA